jgi:hypothetical protein
LREGGNSSTDYADYTDAREEEGERKETEGDGWKDAKPQAAEQREGPRTLISVKAV